MQGFGSKENILVWYHASPMVLHGFGASSGQFRLAG